MIFNIVPFGIPPFVTEDSFTFSGSYEFSSDENGNFELALYESGTLAWGALPGLVDVFLVANGKDGNPGAQSGVYILSGKGGDGGQYCLADGVELDASMTATVGNTTTLVGTGNSYSSANGPAAKPGGNAAKIMTNTNSIQSLNTGGTMGVNAYNADDDETMIASLSGSKFGSSGGGGDARNALYTYASEHGGTRTCPDGSQAGDGGKLGHISGYDATGHGNGGGGGFGDGVDPNTGTGGGGDGSAGLILIRNHRG